MLGLRLAALLLTIIGSIPTALAATYTLEFRGRVTQVSGLSGTSVGDTILGQLSYADATDGAPAATTGLYDQTGPGYSFSAGTVTRSDLMQRVAVFNGTALGLFNPGDGIEYQGRANGTFDGAAGTFFYVSLLGADGPLSSDALPTGAPDIAAFSSRTVFWGVDSRASTPGPFLLGELTSIAVIPEPGTYALLLAGLGLLGAAGVRRRD